MGSTPSSPTKSSPGSQAPAVASASNKQARVKFCMQSFHFFTWPSALSPRPIPTSFDQEPNLPRQPQSKLPTIEERNSPRFCGNVIDRCPGSGKQLCFFQFFIAGYTRSGLTTSPGTRCLYLPIRSGIERLRNGAMTDLRSASRSTLDTDPAMYDRESCPATPLRLSGGTPRPTINEPSPGIDSPRPFACQWSQVDRHIGQDSDDIDGPTIFAAPDRSTLGDLGSVDRPVAFLSQVIGKAWLDLDVRDRTRCRQHPLPEPHRRAQPGNREGCDVPVPPTAVPARYLRWHRHHSHRGPLLRRDEGLGSHRTSASPTLQPTAGRGLGPSRRCRVWMAGSSDLLVDTWMGAPQ